MSVNSISNVTATAAATNTTSKKTTKEEKKDSNFNDTAAVYEKSSSSSKADRSAIVKALQDDAEARNNQLMEIVRKSMTGQAGQYNQSQGLKSLFENLTLDANTIAQAKADIADDGYWGVEQTSNRILDFAKALSGNDPDKADQLLNAFKKGFSQATAAWGDKLPDICQRTYDAVVEKFDSWKNSTGSDE